MNIICCYWQKISPLLHIINSIKMEREPCAVYGRNIILKKWFLKYHNYYSNYAMLSHGIPINISLSLVFSHTSLQSAIFHGLPRKRIARPEANTISNLVLRISHLSTPPPLSLALRGRGDERPWERGCTINATFSRRMMGRLDEKPSIQRLSCILIGGIFFSME